MTDIVERLRRFEGSDDLGDGDFAVCVHAADEIERLRKALRSIANNTGCVEACPCWAKLRHKAERALLEDGR